MNHRFEKIRYGDLKSRQKENYNFHKVSAVLADYGFTTMWLNDDWQGADFIAPHIDGETFLRVQLKSRLTFDKKYLGKDISIAFPEDGRWYLYPHDELLNTMNEEKNIKQSQSWQQKGLYHFPSVPNKYQAVMQAYQI